MERKLLRKKFRKVWIYLTRLSCLFGNFWKCWSIAYRKLSEIQTGSSGCVGSQRTLSWAKAVFERRTPIRSGLFAFMSKFIKRKYSRSTNVVASHDGALKWKRPHFRLTCAVQKRLCLSSILGQWCVSLTPNNTKTIERMTCHCFLRPIRRDLTKSSYTTALLGMHKNQGRQNEGHRPFLLDKKTWLMILNSWLRCWAGLYEVCKWIQNHPPRKVCLGLNPCHQG